MFITLKNSLCATLLQNNYSTSLLSIKHIARALFNTHPDESPHYASQLYNYFLVLDFEATCDRLRSKKQLQEIIEFPVLKVCSKTFNIESVFHKYVKPRVRKVSDFCTKLTGITQEMVDNQPYLEEVLQELDMWMNDEGLFTDNNKFAFVTSGSWDLSHMLPRQCEYFKIPIHSYMNSYINIIKCFKENVNFSSLGIIGMLNFLKLQHKGRLHSGIDDCRNIVEIIKALAEKGYQFHINCHRKQLRPSGKFVDFGELDEESIEEKNLLKD